MLGAIVGDIVGSPYERAGRKGDQFPLFSSASRFTDDTVLTVAVADALLGDRAYGPAIRRWGRQYPRAGYGGAFRQWLWTDPPQPYGSFGNGSAMRASPVGWACATIETALAEAEQTALPTHNHPEGVKGAQAVALAVFMARQRLTKEAVRQELARRFGYDLSRSIDEIRPSYSFDVTCQGSVPEALIAFLDANDFEEAIRLAVSLGGDADTQACIAGSVAEAFWGIPRAIAETARGLLTPDLLDVLDRFQARFGVPQG
jgi:ADP-ribosylglycohydrolase